MLIGVLASGHQSRRLFTWGILLAFLYSWGKVSSVYSSVYVLIPLIEKVPEAGRAFFMFQFFLAGLAAMGTEVLGHPLPRSLKRRFQITANMTVAATSAILVALLTAVLLQVRQQGVIKPESFIPHSSAAVLLLLSAMLVALRRYRLIRLRSIRAGIVFLVAFDLVSFVQSHTPQKNSQSSDSVYAETDTTRFLKQLPGLFRVVDLDGSLPLNFGDAYRIQTIYGYGASLRKDFHDFINSNNDRDTAMRMLNVRYYVSKADIPQMHRIHSDLQSGVSVYEDAYALPRFAFAGAGEVADPSGIGRFLLRNPRKCEAIEVVSYQPDRIDLQANVEVAGFLWLSELAYPGWKVFVDSNAAAMLVSDSIFRTVYLTPGKHRISFVFRPIPVLAGAVISVFSCLVVIIVAAFGLRGRPKP
jgi:hypothetical protein